MKRYAISFGIFVAVILATLPAQINNPTIVPNFITNEVVAGGTTTFTLAHIPTAGTVQLFSGSAAIWPGGGADYTISGATITANTPIAAGTLHASYRF